MAYSIVLLAVSGFSFLFVLVSRFLLSAWMPALYIPLSLGLITFILYLFNKREALKSYLFLKQKRETLNVFTTSLCLLTFLISANILLQRYDWFVDLSEGKINSLTSESQKILELTDSSIQVRVFYKTTFPKEEKNKVKELLSLYSQESPWVDVSFHNIHTENRLAEKYMSQSEARESCLIVLEKEKRRAKVSYPFDEVKISTAFLKLVKPQVSRIYFTLGHGERVLEGDPLESLSFLRETLQGLTIETLPLYLNKLKKIPEDASALAIIGPKTVFLQSELKLVEDYLKGGGRVLFAVDPGLGKELYGMFERIGLSISPQYLVNDTMSVSGRGLSGVVGTTYASDHPVTESFKKDTKYTLFDLASPLSVEKKPNIQSQSIVRSSSESFMIQNSLNEEGAQKQKKREAHTVGVFIKGKLQPHQKAEFSFFGFGDSDFLSNKDFNFLYNKELSLNLFNFLSGDSQLANIKLSGPKATPLVITPMRNRLLIVSYLGFPIFFFSLAFFLWLKRRENQ